MGRRQSLYRTFMMACLEKEHVSLVYDGHCQMEVTKTVFQPDPDERGVSTRKEDTVAGWKLKLKTTDVGDIDCW